MNDYENPRERVIASGSMPEWMTLDAAAGYLKVSKPTLYRWIQDGRLIAYELPAGRGRRLRREDLDAVLKPSGAFEALVDLGIQRATALGHDMANEGSSDKPGSETAFFSCRNCGEVFTVGYESVVDRYAHGSGLRLIAATAHRAICSALPPGSSKYIGEVAVIPPNDPLSQPVTLILRELGVVAWGLRERPDPDNHYSLRFPLEAWAVSLADARERLLHRARDAVANVLRGTGLQPDAVVIELVPDTVHGPSLG